MEWARSVAEPDRGVRLDGGGERDVVDEGALDASDAAGGDEGLAADQHGAAGGRGDAGTRVVHPGEGVEQGEEIRRRRGLGRARRGSRS